MHDLKIASKTDSAPMHEPIYYGQAQTPFGLCLCASLEDRLCWASFEKDADTSLARLQRQWRGQLREDKTLATEWSRKVLDHLNTGKSTLQLLLLGGTAFQRAVWQALLKIPRGQTTSYQGIALAIGKPKAVRAVGQAVGANPLAIIIPCHRVVRKNGTLGGFAYGSDFKQALLAVEQKA
jgi:AraC family transcriptional regulator, regulatory protein of adaptative response / methylated-DNA-[protein]-cysteine methyltransferase